MVKKRKIITLAKTIRVQNTEIDLWINLIKKNFKFTSGEITKEFLFITGHLKGAHNEKCPTFKKIENLNPMWKVFS